MSYAPEGYEPQPQDQLLYVAAERVKGPAIGLLIVGILNLLMTGYGLLQAWQAQQVPPAVWDAEMQKRSPQQWEELKKQGWTAESLMDLSIKILYVVCGVGLAAAILTMVAAARMLALRSYGLAIFGSVLAVIPCLSLTACILVGIGIGVWSLVVLLNNDVRAAFRAAGG
jgi:hypothetical protein